ncbi:MAG TPA: ABC transporter permease subunit [Candidatus Limnocylindrales bacterium]
MLLRNVFLKSLRDLRWPSFWTGLGMAVLGFYFMWLYPTFGKQLDLQAMVDAFPPAIKALVGGSLIDLSSPEGFLNMELFPLMLPLILGGFAMAVASGATAGEESRGTLDVLLAAPIGRLPVLVEKVAAIVLATVAVAVCLFVAIWGGAAFTGTALALDKVAAAVALATLLALAFGALTLAIAAFTGERAVALGIAGAVLVVTYFVNALAPMVDALDRIRGLSPFYYYIGSDPVRNGLDVGHAAILGALAVTLFVVALVAFERRDLTA